MYKYNPSDAEVTTALRGLRAEQPGMGVKKIVQNLHQNHPEWAVDSKKVKNLLKSLEDSPPAPAASSPEKDVVVAGLEANGMSSAITLSKVVSGDPPVDDPKESSPMEALMKILRRLCAGGDSKTARRAAQIDMTLKSSETVIGCRRPILPSPSSFTHVDYSFAAPGYPMKSCKLAATIVLQFGAPDHALPGCIAWASRSLGGLPNADRVTQTPSADLPREYNRVQAQAVAAGRTTILAVNLVDVEMILRGEGRKLGGINFESFSHCFVMVIGPEGVRILQAWGEWGYSLGENMKSSASRLRTFKEAEDFVQNYDELSRMKGVWDERINDLYGKLFGVDILRLTRRGGPMKKPMVPQFKAWTRIKELADIKIGDVVRWESVLDAIDERFRI